jgi:hypothetical protein
MIAIRAVLDEDTAHLERQQGRKLAAEPTLEFGILVSNRGETEPEV